MSDSLTMKMGVNITSKRQLKYYKRFILETGTVTCAYFRVQIFMTEEHRNRHVAASLQVEIPTCR
jgi:hypothetical protein